jgi:hypothetical protein
VGAKDCKYNASSYRNVPRKSTMALKARGLSSSSAHRSPLLHFSSAWPLQLIAISLDLQLLTSSSHQPFCAKCHSTWPEGALHYVYRDAVSTPELVYPSGCLRLSSLGFVRSTMKRLYVDSQILTAELDAPVSRPVQIVTPPASYNTFRLVAFKD